MAPLPASKWPASAAANSGVRRSDTMEKYSSYAKHAVHVHLEDVASLSFLFGGLNVGTSVLERACWDSYGGTVFILPLPKTKGLLRLAKGGRQRRLLVLPK